MRYQLQDCDEMISRVQQAMLPLISGQENKFSGIDALRRLQRRHADVSDRVTKLHDRACQAAEVRNSFWRRYSTLEACFEQCRRDTVQLVSSADNVDDKLLRYEASVSSIYILVF